jgi:hypothetical protein
LKGVADRATIDELWENTWQYVTVAANADLLDYRAYRWVELLRFDYTTGLLQFPKAIEGYRSGTR